MRQNKTSLFFTFVVGVLASVLVVGELRLIAQANDPIVGTWLLDRTKSTFTTQANPLFGTAGGPDKRTMKFERVPEGIRHVTETVDNGGFSAEIYKLQYTFKVDGKDYNADAQMPVNTVSFKRIDANTLERSGKYRGQVVETVTYAVSADGKVLTVTQKGTTQGAEVSSVQVFNRQ